MNKTLRIELKSDLCTSSGFAYAGIVDNDVSYDKYGIPYISGRRIKGCIKEAGLLIDVDTSFFGEKGQRESSEVVIGNAYPEDYDELVENLKICRTNKDIKKYVKPENVLSFFTTVKAQTKLLDGVAEENTLRFTRTINQYSVTGKNMVFEALISFPDDKEDTMKVLIKALRNIGLKRNRGLGSIRCTLQDSKDETEINIKNSSKSAQKVIRITLKNDAPILISGEDEQVSNTYITGGQLLGALAGRFLKESNDMKRFGELFLNPAVVFSNLYPENDGQVCLPVPLYVRKLKKTDKLVNMTKFDPSVHSSDKDEDADNEYNIYNGNVPKKIRNQYLCCKDDSYCLHEVNTEIIYHHSTDGEGLLFYLEAIEPGQTFTGEIICPTEYADEIVNLLKNKNFYFGKSKSTQYGKCTLQSVVVEDYMEFPKTASGTIFVTLDSDGIFLDKNGNYTVNHDEVKQMIADQLKGITEETGFNSFVQTKSITGYSTVHNLRKQDIPAIAAGSAFAFKVDSGIREFPLYLGKKGNEGFGKYHIFDVDESAFEMSTIEEGTSSTDYMKLDKDTTVGKMVYEIMKFNLLDEISDKVHTKKLNIKPAALGRLTLMLVEAINSSTDEKHCFKDLWMRINSIKSEGTSKEIKRFVKDILAEEGKFDEGNLMKTIAATRESYKNLEKYFGNEIAKQCVHEVWIPYLKNNFGYQKYMK